MTFYDMEENKQIELRSEKVRNIIGQIPPVLLRNGISIIGLSLLMLIIIAAFVPYQPTIDIKLRIEQDSSGELKYSALIPEKAMDKKSNFENVSISTPTELALPEHLKIGSISDTVHISPDGVWRIATLYHTGMYPRNIRLEETVSIPGKIALKKKSVLQWIVQAM